MSRIGKAPIKVDEKETASVTGRVMTVKGPLGTRTFTIPQGIDVQVANGEVKVSRINDDGDVRGLHGLVRALIQNMVTGVTTGFKKELEVVGVGYRADVKGKDLNLSLGYSHPIVFSIPEGVKIQIEKNTKIIISGFDKYLVGETAAQIRRFRPPEPYKGKGVKYIGEIIVKKVGKAAATTGGK